MQHTAVEWLINELKKHEEGTTDYFSKAAIFNRAIRMDNEQKIEFAKIHVEACKKEIIKNVKTKEDVAIFAEGTFVTHLIDNDSILNSYPLSNIKYMEKLKYSDELIKSSSNVMAGFNQFIFGMGEPKRGNYGDISQWYEEQQGYDCAKKMAKEKGIAFTHIFKCNKDKSYCHPFGYGGGFVCNSCGRNNLDKDWWKIKVVKDGNAFCCHGLDFINLQSSKNYAFGDTFEEAISNYESVMLSLSFQNK